MGAGEHLRCEAGISECAPDSAVYAIEVGNGQHFYCAHHARMAGIPVASGAIGVRVFGFHLVGRPSDFDFDPARPAGQRFGGPT